MKNNHNPNPLCLLACISTLLVCCACSLMVVPMLPAILEHREALQTLLLVATIAAAAVAGLLMFTRAK